MARMFEDYSVRDVVVDDVDAQGAEYGPERAAVEEFVLGLVERESLLTGDMGRVLGGDSSFKPCWMQDNAVGVGSLLEVVDVYAEKSGEWSPEQCSHVAGVLSGVLVEPAAAALRGLEVPGPEGFRDEAAGELLKARSGFEEAMLSGDTHAVMVGRAVLNQVYRDVGSVSRGEAL